jgi:pyruvate kinase
MQRHSLRAGSARPARPSGATRRARPARPTNSTRSDRATRPPRPPDPTPVPAPTRPDRATRPPGRTRPSRPTRPPAPASSRKSSARIVATLGPASTDPRIVREMILAGVDLFRFNMSHGSRSEHAGWMRRVRRVAQDVGRPVGLLMDLQGPKLRTARNESGERIRLPRGKQVRVAAAPGTSRPGRIVVDLPGGIGGLKQGTRILIDDGLLALEITGGSGDELVARVVRGGLLKERAGVNLPGRSLGVRVPTRKDLADLDLAVAEGVDFLALSFVETAEDLRRLRRSIRRRARTKSSEFHPAIIAKIERPQALSHLEEILVESDGVMVARGDLGVEISLEKVPVWQKRILRRAREHRIPAITATQMLESMIEKATPTRAEVSDVANAVFDGTDALMLSAETAVGAYPVQTVETLARIAREAEASLRMERSLGSPIGELEGEGTVPIRAMVHAAVDLAHESSARWIVIFTLSGRTGFLTAAQRPQVAILCLTPHEWVRRRLSLAWNATSLVLPLARTADEMMQRGLALLREAGLTRKGDRLVLLGGASNLPGATHLLRLVEAEG